ncbi:MAG: metal-dependent hydrolase [Microcoleaceae cyanobacterium]
MPSPIGHTLAGLCGFILVQPTMSRSQRVPLLILTTVIANLPDIDILLGLILAGDPFIYHRQGTHSLIAALLVGGLVAGLTQVFNLKWPRVGVWVTGLYLSHLFLDMLVSDQYPPAGVQGFWPLSQSYLIFPITLFGGLQFSEGGRGLLGALFNPNNLLTLMREIVILLPVVWLTWQGVQRSQQRP